MSGNPSKNDRLSGSAAGSTGERRPLVSICCATYNHQAYIRDCLEGMLAQKADFAFEILVHDDASTDGTREIVAEYEARYPERIKGVYQQENQYSKGIRAVVTHFLRPLAQGEYIALCEGDDYWTDPHKLALQVAVMKRYPAVSLCFHAAAILRPDGKLRGRYAPYRQSRVACMEDIIRRKIHFCPTASLLLRKADWLDYPDFFIRCHVGDYPLMLYFATRGDVYYLHKKMAVYRKKHPGSWTLTYIGSSRDTQLLQMQTEVDMLAEFDRYTAYKYHDAVVKKQWKTRLHTLRRLKMYDSLCRSPYREQWGYLPFTQRISLYGRQFIRPSGWKRFLSRLGFTGWALKDKG